MASMIATTTAARKPTPSNTSSATTTTMMTDDYGNIMASSSSSSSRSPTTNPSKSNTFGAAAATTTTTGMKKFHVPSSDRRLVLSAIDNQLNMAKDAWGEKNFNSGEEILLHQSFSSNGNNDNNINLVAKGEFFLNCINQTGASLHRQLELVTTPVEEAELESVLDSFQMRLATATLQHGSDTNKKNNNCHDEDNWEEEEDWLSSSSSSEDEDFEFDDAEIVDDEAYHQVKQLRAQARDIASRVLTTRDETVRRAMEMTQRNLEELMRVHGFDPDLNHDKSQGDCSDAVVHHEEEGTSNNHEYERCTSNGSGDTLNPLRMAIQTLVSSLNHVDSNLGDNLESLKETIGTIDSSVEKIQRHLKGDESALSRTEKALLASSCENPEEDTTIVGGVKIVAAYADKERETTMMNQDKKLAFLLAG